MISRVERTPWKTRVAVCALCAVFLLGVAAGVLSFRARQHFSRGLESLRLGQEEKALYFFERSIGAAVPPDPVQVRAVQEMMEVAQIQEKEGDLRGAVRTYDRLRASLEETRPLFGFRRETFEEAGKRSKIIGKEIGTETVWPGQGDVKVGTYPSPTVMALFSFFLWVYSASMLSLRVGMGPGKWWPWALITLAVLVAWVSFLG